MDCCKSIDKRETQFIQIPYKSNSFNPQKLNQIKPIEFSQIIFAPEGNIENKNKENNIIYRNENNKNNKKYNENTNSDTNYKDITIKYSKKVIKDRFYSPNHRYDELLKSKTNEENNNKLNIDNINDIKNNNEHNKEEDIEINERKSPIIAPRYISTNFKMTNNSYSKYFENMEECRKKLEMTEKVKNRQNNISSNFPVKYNQQNKYITFFTEDDR